jgi:hypothetical protein
MSFLGKTTPARSVQQLDLFPSSTPTIVGTFLSADRPCPHCGCVEAVVGSSKGPHDGSLACATCNRRVGWLAGWRYGALIGTQIVDGSVLASSFAFASGLSTASVRW